MKTFAQTAHKLLSGFIGLAVLIQMFLAGLWHAEVLATPEAHVFFGLGILLASLLALIFGLIARLPRHIIGMSALLFVLILAQPILMEFRRNGVPLLSAFHTLNAAFVGMVSGVVMTRLKALKSAETTPILTTTPVTGD